MEMRCWPAMIVFGGMASAALAQGVGIPPGQPSQFQTASDEAPSVLLSWLAPSAGGTGDRVTSYEIKLIQSEVPPSQAAWADPGVPRIMLVGPAVVPSGQIQTIRIDSPEDAILLPGEQYYVRIVAFDAGGNGSVPFVQTFTMVTLVAPGTPVVAFEGLGPNQVPLSLSAVIGADNPGAPDEGDADRIEIRYSTQGPIDAAAFDAASIFFDGEVPEGEPVGYSWNQALDGIFPATGQIWFSARCRDENPGGWSSLSTLTFIVPEPATLPSSVGGSGGGCGGSTGTGGAAILIGLAFVQAGQVRLSLRRR